MFDDDDDMFGGVGSDDNDEFNEDDFGDEDDEKFSSACAEREEKDPTTLYYLAKESLERTDGKEKALSLLDQAAQGIPTAISDNRAIGAKIHKRFFRALVDMGDIERASTEFQAALNYYKDILVPQNLFAEKNFYKIVDAAIGSNFGIDFVISAYDSTENMFEELNSVNLQKLIFKINKRYSQFLLDQIDKSLDDSLLKRLSLVASRMHECCCTTSDGKDDIRNKAPQLAEVYALKLRICILCNNFTILRSLVEKALVVCTGTSPPRVLGVVKECAGMVAIADGLWSRARECFFDAFVNFNEAESPQRVTCLRGLVLASILDFSTISPFDSPEARGIAASATSAGELEGVKRLWKAYMINDLNSFEAILENEQSLINDSVFVNCKEHLIHSLRLHVLAVTLKPYKRVRISFLASKMKVSTLECERLLAELIVDEVVSARINEPEGTVTILEPPSEEELKQKALCDWSENALNMAHILTSKLLNDK